MHRGTLVITSLVILVFGSGFRLIDGVKWDISRDKPTVWIEFDEAFFDVTFDDPDQNEGDDIMEGVAEDERVETLLRLVVRDYNTVETSFLRFDFYPVAATPVSGDGEAYEAFSTQVADQRKIVIKLGSASSSPVAAGEAVPESDDEGKYLENCTIVITSQVAKKARSLKSTLTHELGHCVGIDHNHKDWDSVMSYNASRHDLGVDDKMALTYLYPLEKGFAKEQNSLGMSCSRSK